MKEEEHLNEAPFRKKEEMLRKTSKNRSGYIHTTTHQCTGGQDLPDGSVQAPLKRNLQASHHEVESSQAWG